MIYYPELLKQIHFGIKGDMKIVKRIIVLLIAGMTGFASVAGGALTINADVDRGGSVNTYSGVGVAPDSGTVWNSLPVVQDASGDITVEDALDSNGNSTGVSIVMNRDGGGTLKVYDDSSTGNPNPSDLMRDYGYWDGWSVTFSGLDAGTYYLYGMGHQNKIDGTCSYTLDAANGGASAETTETLSDFRDIFQTDAEGNTYVKLEATVDDSGVLSFTTSAGINGFQLLYQGTSTAEPSIAGLNDQSVTAGGSIILSPTVSGSPAPECQWLADGVVLSGETNETLALNNIQLELDGTVFSLIAENSEGAVTNSMTLTVLEVSTELPAFPGADGAAKYVSGGRGGIVYHVTKLNSELNDSERASEGTLIYGLIDSNFPDEPRTIVFDVAGVFHLGMGDTDAWDSMGNAWDSQSRQSISATDLTIAGQTAPGPVIIMGGTLKPSGRNIIIRNVTIAAGFGMKAFWEPTKTPPTSPTIPTAYTMDAIDVTGQDIMIDHLDALYCSDESISCNENADNLTIQYCTSAMAQNYQGHGYGHLLQPDTDHKLSYIHNFDAHIGNRLPRVGSEVGTGAQNDFRNNVTYNWVGSRPGYAGDGQYSKNNFINNFYLEGNGGDYEINDTRAGGTGIFNGASSAYTFVYAAGNVHDTNRDGDPGDSAGCNSSTYFQNSALQSAAYDVDIGVTLDADQAFTNVLRYVGARWWERDYDFLAGNTDVIDTPNERLVHEAFTGTGRIEAWADDPYDTSASDGEEWQSLWAQRMDAEGNAPYNRVAGWDSDADGMPDDWETAHGLDPDVANNNGDFDNDGYTDLEEYLNDVAAWPAPDVIHFTGASGSRYADIVNWIVYGEPVNISGRGTVATCSAWQPSRYDSVSIESDCVVDAVGQHADSIVLSNDASLLVTNGWLDVAGQVEIEAGCTLELLSVGELRVTNNIVNNGTLRLTGSDGLTLGGYIENNGVLDLLDWEGTEPEIINNGTILSAPSIRTQPEGQSITVGQTAALETVVWGGPALVFQWQKDGVDVAGANSETLVIENAQVDDCGVYTLTVSNAYGVAVSSSAELSVAGPDGFCMVSGTTTGGSGGTIVTVTNGTDFVEEIGKIGARIIQVQGVLSIGRCFCAADKTIVGMGTNATLLGNMNISGVDNVIVRNLRITAPANDGLTIWNSNHVWVDHCSIYDTGDGLCDMNRGSQYVTVSWCRFFYVNQIAHKFTMIADGYNSDTLTLGWYTLHHNWWGAGCDQRMASSSYGRLHYYNNYFNTPGNYYASLARVDTQILSENNYYQNVRNPLYSNGEEGGYIHSEGNIYSECWDQISGGADTVFEPTYNYTLDAAADVPSVVMAGAGAPGPDTIEIPPKVWDGGASDNNLASGNNWSRNEIPKDDDVLLFAGSTRLSVNNNLESGTEFSGLVFSNSAGAFTLDGNSFRIGKIITDNSVAEQTINADMDFSYGQDHYTPDRIFTVSTESGSLVINGDIAGAANGYFDSYNITKEGPGELTLTGENSFVADLQLNAGMLEFDSGSLGSGEAININGGGLCWSDGNTEDISERTVTIQSGGAVFDSGANTITLSSAIGGGGPGGLTKTGSGTIMLNGSNNYSGPTVVSEGTLAFGESGAIPNSSLIILSSNAYLNVSGRSDGILSLNSGQSLQGAGRVSGSLRVGSGASIAPGAAIGNLYVVFGELVFENGSYCEIDVDKSQTVTNDCIYVGMGSVTYGGQLEISHSGSDFSEGDCFKIFEANGYNGSFESISLPALDTGLCWSNSLSVNGTISVVASSVNTTPTNLVFSVNGAGTNQSLTLSWPMDYIGWTLEAQTNGLGTNWFVIPGSSSTNVVSLPLFPDAGSAFFRMRYP